MRTNKPLDQLALSQIERRLNSIRKAANYTKVKPGWIQYTRQALGMTLKKLAERTGVSKATVAQAERSEQQGKTTIATLKKMAEAMECEFVYAFVPKSTIKATLREQALKKAVRLLSNADTHMTLEDQKVEDDMQSRVERLADRLIQKGDVW
jgi:predicted DNA-binding mobile mystery protein A